jgi:hypothetical protein
MELIKLERELMGLALDACVISEPESFGMLGLDNFGKLTPTKEETGATA